ncbi:hypothetical protein F4604DRAFT_1973834 [Suillus subluteus]|nr:hypothetical protein F4604DRAFT_1973834 [Suillus subluteus]
MTNELMLLRCHPSETPAGSNFSQLCPDKDNTFLAAYQQYAELIFHKPIFTVQITLRTSATRYCQVLEMTMSLKSLKDATMVKRMEDVMVPWIGIFQVFISFHARVMQADASMIGFATSSTKISDASMSGFGNTEAGISDASSFNELDQSVFNSEAQSNTSFEQAQPDAWSGFGNTEAGISDASSLNELDQSVSNSEAQSNTSFGQAQPDASLAQAQLHASFDWHNISTLPPDPTSVPGLNEVFRSSFSHADLIAMGFLGGGSTMPNPFPPAFSSLAPSLTDARSTVPGYYDAQHDTRYGTQMWNFSNLDSQGWEMPSLSSFLSSPISAERTTTTTEQDEVLPHFTRQSPILPAANHPAYDSAEDLDSIHTGAGLPKSKRKRKSKLPAAEVDCNPAIEPTPTITPMNTAKPKAKPKAKPLTKSGAVTETLHATADEGNVLGHLTAPNTATKRNPAVDIGAAPRVSKRNDVADAIGSDGSTFVGVGRDDPPVLEDVGASMMKRPPNSTMGSMIPANCVVNLIPLISGISSALVLLAYEGEVEKGCSAYGSEQVAVAGCGPILTMYNRMTLPFFDGLMDTDGGAARRIHAECMEVTRWRWDVDPYWEVLLIMYERGMPPFFENGIKY